MTKEDNEAYIWYYDSFHTILWKFLMKMDIGERSFYFTIFEHCNS